MIQAVATCDMCLRDMSQNETLFFAATANGMAVFLGLTARKTWHANCYCARQSANGLC
jgi:hypothetical protein